MIGQNTEILKQLQGRRKFPRLFMLAKEEALPIQGIELMLPDRRSLEVLSLSLAGVLVNSTGNISTLKIGQVIDCKLKIESVKEPVPLKVRVIRLSPKTASLMMESISSQKRLAIEQIVKDQIIFRNISEGNLRGAIGDFSGARWWNGPFDTNFIYWTESSSAVISKAIVEYDGLVFQMEKDSWTLNKSLPAYDEVKAYFGSLFEIDKSKVAMGANWKDRLIRLLSESVERKDQFAQPDLIPFLQILKNIKNV